MKLTGYYRLKFTFKYFCFKYVSEHFINLESVNKYDHHSAQHKWEIVLKRQSLLQRESMCRLMTMIQVCFLQKILKICLLVKRREREKRADSMHCIEEIAPFQHYSHYRTCARSKISAGNFNACSFIPQAFSTTSYLTLLHYSQNLLLSQFTDSAKAVCNLLVKAQQLLYQQQNCCFY